MIPLTASLIPSLVGHIIRLHSDGEDRGYYLVKKTDFGIGAWNEQSGRMVDLSLVVNGAVEVLEAKA